MNPPEGTARRRDAMSPPGGERAAAGSGASDGEARLLAGQLGAEVAAVLSSALERVRTLGETGRINRHELRELHDEIRRARLIAMLGQRVSRLAAGSVRQAPETLELPELLRDALGQRLDEVAMRGLELRQRLQPATVSADPALLFALLAGLLDWAFEHCRLQTVTLSTGMNPWPVHAVLRCEFAWRAPDRLGADAELAFAVERAERGDDPSRLDTVSWRLVEQACRAMGVRVARKETPWQVHLELSFPEAPRRWPRLVDALDALEGDDPFGVRARPLAGSRLLLFAQRPDVRHVVLEAVATTGMLIDSVSTLAELHACGLASHADVLLVDERGAEVDRVLADLKAGGSGPALVHVAEAFRALEISSTGRFEILRVGRDSAMRDLPVALGYALTR